MSITTRNWFGILFNNFWKCVTYTRSHKAHLGSESHFMATPFVASEPLRSYLIGLSSKNESQRTQAARDLSHYACCSFGQTLPSHTIMFRSPLPSLICLLKSQNPTMKRLRNGYMSSCIAMSQKMRVVVWQPLVRLWR